jgi:hypothetical protein
VPHGDGLPVPEHPDNFVMYSDDEDSVYSNSEEQQPLASRDLNYLPNTDSFNYKITDGGSMSSSENSNFQKIRHNIRYQVYNSGIYYITP